jgi:pimeloyl-ACP methyl ester carboxylesterase
MTTFLDVRALSGGGDVSENVQVRTGTSLADYTDLGLGDLLGLIHGKDVLIGTHGFNVNRSDGIVDLSSWERLLSLPDSGMFVGLLWPGDSESLHALSYPAEPEHAMAAGAMVAAFVDSNFCNAASVSFVSHSLGARVILEAMSKLKLPVRRAILMAGAIGDDCLTSEFADVPPKVAAITALASKEDGVLRWAFPLGDLAAEIIDHKHPWWESALGRFGPSGRPQHYQSPGQIPPEWDYGHGDYLRVDPPAPQVLPATTVVPLSGQKPLNGADGWQEAWSASVVSGRFK